MALDCSDSSQSTLLRNIRQKHNSSQIIKHLRPLQLALIVFLVGSLQFANTSSSDSWMEKCSVCHCNWNSGKHASDCKNKGLTSVPQGISSSIQVLDLSNNMIAELRSEEFVRVSLENLHKLFMRNCTLQEINRNAFKELKILIELDLSNNFISELHPETFGDLLKLRSILMNSNQIEVLHDNLFFNLPHLAKVEIRNNRIKSIGVHAFNMLPSLITVDLVSNNLTVLYSSNFQSPKLLHLSLANNPWNCSCALKEFRDFVIKKRLYTPPTDCHDPPHLRGKLWNEIPSDAFACQPRILGSIRSFVEAQSDNITLPCRIEGVPRPNVTWIFNKRPVNTNDYRIKILNSIEQGFGSSNTSPTTFTSELRIYGVRSTDKGVYTCIADSRGGHAESEFQLMVNGDFISALDSSGGTGVLYGSSTTDSQSNVLLIICLIITTFLLLLIIIVLVICWYCRRIRTYQKDSNILSENALISSKMDKSHNGSILEGSVIMEMQKSLLTEVNPVEKPPRRTDIEGTDGADDSHEIKKTLLDETQFASLHQRDDETHSIALSDTTVPRGISRHTYFDNSYGTSLPPDLLAFPTSVPPTSPSMQSSHSNIPEQIIYGVRSPPLASPVYAHFTPHGIYGTTTIAAATPNGFMTLQHPKSRNLALIAAANNRQHQQQSQQQQQQQQSPFMPAPVVYTPATTAVVMKQGYMTIPRKPRVPSWAPSSASTAQPASVQLNEFQSPTSPNPSDSGTATTAELQPEPFYDNLGLRTTAGGSSTLNLHKAHQAEAAASGSRYTMRDRPLPATPSLTSVASNATIAHAQQQYVPTNPNMATGPSTSVASKIYEPIHELVHHQHPTTTSDTEPLYNTARHNSGMTIVPSTKSVNNSSTQNTSNNNSSSSTNPNNSNLSNAQILGNSNSNISMGSEMPMPMTKVAKIPPRPPPKPKKKIAVTTTRSGQGSTSQLFDDEGEDGTEV